MANEAYIDNLTPTQVQTVLDSLGVPWRKHKVNPEGWVDISGLDYFNSDLGVNIKHGGWVDHYQNGDPSARGTINELVAMIHSGINSKTDLNINNLKEAHLWINEILGTNSQIPELESDQMFAKDVIAQKIENYTMVPNSVWKSTELSASSKIVWMAIQERCGKGKNYAFPGINTIQKDTGLGRSTVQRALVNLLETGYLIEIPKGKGRAPKRYPVCKLNHNYVQNEHTLCSK